MMNNLNDLSVEKKTKLLKIFLALFVGLNILIFLPIYHFFSTKQAGGKEYESLIQNFVKDYVEEEDKFEEFSFYENYNDLVLENHELNEGYRSGVNKFSNISQKDFYGLFDFVRNIATLKQFGEISKLESVYYDWSKKEVVIRDQRGFDVSHIFAVLTTLEYQINENQSLAGEESWISLSAQEVIDCCSICMSDPRPERVYDYIKEFGVTTEALYPYVNNIFNQNPNQCRRQEFSTPRFRISKYQRVHGCSGLQLFLAKGPIVVGIDARKIVSYNYGIFSDCERKKTHYATLVGISYDSWKLQNSWGRKWGQRGYMRISAGDTCGVCLHPTVPILLAQ